MQVRNVSSNNCNNYNYHNKKAKPQQQGFGNALVSTVAFIENNGFVGEFFTVDGLGMMGPRTLQAYLRNREELGHLNYKSGTEEAIREVLTGPSMFLIPMGLVLLSGKLFGRATKVNVATLRELGKISKEVVGKSENLQHFNKKFYDNTISKIFEHHAKEVDSAGTETLSKAKAEIVENLEKLANDKLKKSEIKKLKTEITEKIVHMNQLFGISTKSPQSINIGGKIETKDSIDQFVGGISKNSNDFIDDLLNYTKDKDIKKIVSLKDSNEATGFINKTQNDKEGIRKFMSTLSFASVGGFLYAIPLLYKRNKQFPGVDGLVEGQEIETKKTVFSKHKQEGQK